YLLGEVGAIDRDEDGADAAGIEGGVLLHRPHAQCRDIQLTDELVREIALHHARHAAAGVSRHYDQVRRTIGRLVPEGLGTRSAHDTCDSTHTEALLDVASPCFQRCVLTEHGGIVLGMECQLYML